MKKHISHKNLAAFITGSMNSKKHALINEHIQECEKCRTNYEKLMLAISPHYSKEIAPSDRVKDRIMKSFSEIQEQESKKLERGRMVSLLFQPGKIALALASISIIVISVLLYNRIKVSDISDKIPFTVTKVKGSVYINNKPAAMKMSVTDGSRIEVSKEAYIQIKHGKNIIITILGKSLFFIDKATGAGKSNDIDLLFTLLKGSLISNIDHKDIIITYVYNTPTARIESYGTEFLLRADDNKTTVMVKSGRLKIESSQSKEEIITSIEKKYVITRSIEAKSIVDADIELIDSLKEMYDNTESDNNDRPIEDKPLKIVSPSRKSSESGRDAKIDDKIVEPVETKKEIEQKSDLSKDKKDPVIDDNRKDRRESIKKLRDIRKARRELRRSGSRR